MRHHRIKTSILSLANPWLDFLSSDDEESGKWARRVNEELASLSTEGEGKEEGGGKIYAFGTLPFSAPAADRIVGEIEYISSSLAKIRGVIIGTAGLVYHHDSQRNQDQGHGGGGLDDPALDPIWAALEKSQLLVFIHPHYGVPDSLFSSSSSSSSSAPTSSRGKGSGHVLPLSLGFPFETTTAFTRMWLSGVFDRFPRLRVLLAHAGGAVVGLADRVQSCVEHERGFYDEHDDSDGGRRERVRGPKRSLRTVMRQNIYLDGVAYGATGIRAAVEMVGKDKVMWGSDHPFFPPLGGGGGGGGEDGEGEEWMSVRSNLDAVRDA
ncbi:MAG: hypothetical protein Q9191_008580, partial [Dirinaria sp. TL-2023a]